MVQQSLCDVRTAQEKTVAQLEQVVDLLRSINNRMKDATEQYEKAMKEANQVRMDMRKTQKQIAGLKAKIGDLDETTRSAVNSAGSTSR